MALPSVAFVTRQRQLPDAPGLYFVLCDDDAVLYVGMSRKSIRRRWKTWHHVVHDVEQSGLRERTRIAFILYANTDRLQDDERAAIREFRPPFNYGHVPGAYERDQKQRSEACKWIDCRLHDHRKWPALNPTEPWPGWSYFLE